MLTQAGFLFTICQIGAERALKAELARAWPAFRFAFSRPGFVTFKLPADLRLASDFELGSTFARTYGFAVGKATGHDMADRARELWKLASFLKPEHVHVWQRDAALPGDRDFEPGPTPLAEEIGASIATARPGSGDRVGELPVNRVARGGQQVLDCILVEPDEWWVGFHEAASGPSRWPGGVPPLNRPVDLISRAYLKISEALEWSRLPVKPGDRCAEIGSAPGGAAQALLQRGLVVLAIDPAEMDEKILGQPDLTHVRKRAVDMKRREFRDVRWLFADSNVAPQHTLDTVEAIVTHREIHVRGMLLTLKLMDWQLADRIPEYVARVGAWGFEHVQTRQLAFNRREFCLAARR